MKKWLLRIAGVFGLLVLLLAALVAWNQTDYQRFTRYVQNDDLSTVKPGWPGNALDQNDRFMDKRNPFLPKTLELFKWKLGGETFEEEKRRDPWRPEVRDASAFLASDEDGVLWLGHASFYIRLGGVGILTDPVLGEPALLRRVVPVSSGLEKIRDVDYVLLSHDHRDHMDEETLRAIAAKFPQSMFLAGLRSDDVLGEWKTPTNTVGTAGWFQEFKISHEGLRIYFHPVRHWSRRWLMDTNWRLWGSFIIDAGSAKIYFGGDSGYAEHYREAGELYAGIDYFVIGIGAYEPRWFMEPNHNTPAEAVQAFQDAGARFLVPMHYGTFDLTDEPPGQPLQLLFDEAEKKGVRDRVRPLAINEHLLLKETKWRKDDEQF